MKALRIALVLLVGIAATGCYEFSVANPTFGSLVPVYRLNRITGELCVRHVESLGVPFESKRADIGTYLDESRRVAEKTVTGRGAAILRLMSESGFTPEEVQEWRTKNEQQARAGGFSEEEIAEYFGEARVVQEKPDAVVEAFDAKPVCSGLW